MRPDEHKKKKNAAYKKKHGIGQAKAGHTEDQSKPKKNESNKEGFQAQKTNYTKEVKETKGATALKKELKEALTSSSDSEADEVRQPRKNFQRRQIVSNWQKYEVQPENEEQQEARGKSFENLLSMSGDAVAHFRFKDEEEWDVVGALADIKINDDHYAQYLNIDTQQIGQAMDCLPLYKVLGLNPDLFPNGEVEVMENTAAEKRQIYIPQESTLLSSALFSSFCNSNFADQKHVIEDKKPSTNSSTSEQNSHCLASPDHRGSSRATDSPNKTVSFINKDSTPSSVAQAHIDQNLILEDEDLDTLLNLESETANVTTDTNVTKLTQSSKPSHLSDRSKPATMPSSFAIEHEAPTLAYRQESIELEEEKQKKDGVDLEDWLDSILDN